MKEWIRRWWARALCATGFHSWRMRSRWTGQRYVIYTICDRCHVRNERSDGGFHS